MRETPHESNSIRALWFPDRTLKQGLLLWRLSVCLSVRLSRNCSASEGSCSSCTLPVGSQITVPSNLDHAGLLFLLACEVPLCHRETSFAPSADLTARSQRTRMAVSELLTFAPTGWHLYARESSDCVPFLCLWPYRLISKIIRVSTLSSASFSETVSDI